MTSKLGAAFHARRLSRTFMPSTMAYRSGPPLWMTLPHTKPNSHWPRCSPAPQLRRKRPLSEFGLRVEIKKKKQRGGYARAAPRQGLGFLPALGTRSAPPSCLKPATLLLRGKPRSMPGGLPETRWRVDRSGRALVAPTKAKRTQPVGKRHRLKPNILR